MTSNKIESVLLERYLACRSGEIEMSPGAFRFLDEYFEDEFDGPAVFGDLLEYGEKRDRRHRRKSDAGGPLRGNGASEASDEVSFSSPLANRGVQSTSDSEISVPLQSGGYDGGVSVGFQGDWESDKFRRFISLLESAKQRALDLGEPVEELINDLPAMVELSGAKEGLHYRYVFTICGVKYFIHHNAPKGRQAVRVRYLFSSLVGRNLYSLHRAVLDFLFSLGFRVQDEKLSRVDLQVLVDCSMSELLPYLFDDSYRVCRTRKWHLHGDGREIGTYTTGLPGAIQLCIYDKRQELQRCMVSDPVKFQQTIEKCVGEDWFFSDCPITRVEYRLWGDSLVSLGIRTVSDLQERESGLVEWLTTNWFRLLAEPKVRGHENDAQVHPLWERIRSAFFLAFCGIDDNKEVSWSRREVVLCDPEMLERQAVGCLAKAGALSGLVCGVSSAEQFFERVSGLFFRYRNDLYLKGRKVYRAVSVCEGVVLSGLRDESLVRRE
jgi:hypothetical protein